MKNAQQNRFSDFVAVFHEIRLPATAKPVGYAAIIDAYNLNVPFPLTLSAVGQAHKTIIRDGWKIYTPRYEPDPTLAGHLTFALKQEGLDLAVLKTLFLKGSAHEIEKWVRNQPSGSYSRRIWFLYEWLTGTTLNLPNVKRGAYAQIVNPKQQYAIKDSNSPRHRIKNNLPGTPQFCPLVFKTKQIEDCIALNLPDRARDAVKLVPHTLLARAASFLQLKDSRSTFAIEREAPPQDRIQRWGRAIGQAGQHPLDLDELLRLQKIVIGDARFVKLGLRTESGFVGDHDRETQIPLPTHISARHDDLNSLVEGLIQFDGGPAKQLHPAIAASILAFGFVYIHPFEDGNGRIHRYLIHHALARSGFNPPGIIFPISSAILALLDDYKSALESYSARLLPKIEWKPTKRWNVRVLNQTGDFYRFFDATTQTEFLFRCIQRTIEDDIPQETEFLRRHDQFNNELKLVVDMPDRTSELLFKFLHQNKGRLSRRAREQEFARLTDSEIRHIESLYDDAFGNRTE